MLPDTKRPDADTVIWLSEEHAAPDAEAAEQRGAVAALQQMAGDRTFHRILPPEYRPLWEALGEEVRSGGGTPHVPHTTNTLYYSDLDAITL